MKPFDALRRLFPDRGPSVHAVRLAQAKVALAQLQGKKSVTAWGDRGWQPILGGAQLSAEGSFESWSSQQLAEQYSKHSLVRACIDEVAKSVQDGTLQVGRDTENGFEPVDADELLDPLYNDPDLSFGDIWMLVVSRLLSTGASFNILGQYADILGAGEFTPVPTNQMRVYSNGIRVTRYEYYPAQEKPVALKREDVCGLWFPDPARQIGWVSPLAAAAHAYQIDEQREALTHELLKNRVLPGGLLTTANGPTGRSLTGDQAKELKEKIDAACGTDASRRGGLLVVPHGLQYQQGQDLKDIDFAVLNALTETRICMAFGVPPIVVAAKSGLDAATYANYREARRAFYVETIRPMWSFLASGLTRALILAQGLDRTLYYRWDHSQVAELQADADKAMARAVQGYSGQVLTLNEARSEAGHSPDETGRGEQYYSPPAPVATGFGVEGVAPEGKTRCTCHAKGRYPDGTRWPVGTYPEAERLESVFKAHFARQRADALAAVAHGARHRFDLEQENDKLKTALTPVLRDIYEARGKRVLNRIADRLGQGNGRKTRIHAKAEFRPEASFTLYRASYNELVKAQIKKLVAETNETTRADLDEALDRAVAEAHERGESADLRGIVDDVFDGATEWRAKAIAGTESSRAIHDSNVLAAESSGVVKGFLPLISADACEVCLSHEGEFTSLEDAKSQLGQYEGRGLPPWHPHDRCGAEEVLDMEAV